MLRSTLLSLLLLAGGVAPVSSQDPLALYPENYKVLAENDRVRVLDFRLARGATEKTHAHPAHVAVFLVDVKIRFTLPDGTTRIREAQAGETAVSDATAHASENIGPADAHGILVELKNGGSPAPGSESLPVGAITAFTLIHGIPGREQDLKAHLLSLAPPTRSEPGFVRYDLYQHPTKPHEFLRHEVWSSPAALEAHKGAPHLRASWEKRQREGWTTEIVLWNRVRE
jgi:beta-alanine degradation protein BauB